MVFLNSRRRRQGRIDELKHLCKQLEEHERSLKAEASRLAASIHCMGAFNARYVYLEEQLQQRISALESENAAMEVYKNSYLRGLATPFDAHTHFGLSLQTPSSSNRGSFMQHNLPAISGGSWFLQHQGHCVAQGVGDQKVANQLMSECLPLDNRRLSKAVTSLHGKQCPARTHKFYSDTNRQPYG